VEARFACGSMVLFYSFLQKFCTSYKIFVKKNDFFRPAGGEIAFWVSNRVSPVSY
jgi:hypothetical protein